MFSRRSSRQGPDASTADGMDWGVVQDLVRSIQNKQTLSKDTLANTKKSLKSPSKSAVCSTLTTLDSIAANCGPPIRAQLADSRWMEMLLSVCCKNSTAAMPICQLFSNWACSYNHELLGASAHAAIQNLRQRSAIIPPPAPSAYHMAEVAQQGTPMLGFQRGFDFTSVDLWSPAAADSSGSSGSHQGYRPPGEQRAQPSSTTQAGPPMTQKLQAMQQGVHTLRKVDRACQYYLDVGQAVPEQEASQHMQRGWQLAKKCSSWANEVQVMIACEPSNGVLAALLQANDDLLAAVNSWDTTASRLVMLQSRSSAPEPTQRQQSASFRVTPAPEISDSSSSSSSASDMTPATAASGGVFWSHLEAVPNVQLPGSTSQQHAQQAQQQQQHWARVGPSAQQSYPSLLDSGPAQGQHAASTRQRQDSSQRQSSDGSHVDDAVSGLQPQYPHQSLMYPGHQQLRDDGSWQGSLGAGGSMPTALPSNSTRSEGQSEANSRVKEYHGSVLNYRLATPKHSGGPKQQSPFFEDGTDEAPRQSSQPWPEAAAEAQASSSSAVRQPSDPFAVSFDASPSGPHAIAAVPQTAPEPSTNQHSSSSLQAHDSSFTSAAASTMRTEHTAPPRHSAAAQHDSASMSRKPSSSLSTGSRAPSLLTAAQNLSTNSLSSLASGSAAAANARSPSPASEYVGSRADMGEAEIEAQKLRRQIHQMETWHEEESRKRSADHDANVAAVQAQAVAKMKELIEKVKEQTLRERGQADLRLQEAHQAEQTALAHLHSMRKDCRDKDALIAELQRKLSQVSSPAAAKVQSHDLEAERPLSARELSAGSQGLDLAALQKSPFGGVPRCKSAATSQQLPEVAPSAKKGRMLRAGSHLDKGAASLNSLQAYYRQPALRVRFTPGQLEELSQEVPEPSLISHKEWAAALKLPGVQQNAE